MDTSKQDRAKQFMAFEALTGFKEVLEENKDLELNINEFEYPNDGGIKIVLFLFF